jgi:regulator of RNase E activity RraB
MHNRNINIQTAVRHPDGGTYRLHAVGGSGNDITTVNIIKEGFGHCFLGSPDQAREQGFLFGDVGEPGGIPHGTIITHSAHPGRTYGYEWDSRNPSGMAVYRIMHSGTAVKMGTVAYMIESGFQFNVPDSDQPSCDVCGALAEDESVDWCGECGNCTTHCLRQEGCPEDTTDVCARCGSLPDNRDMTCPDCTPESEVNIEDLLDPMSETWEEKDERIRELAEQLEAQTATISDLREEIQQAKESLSLCQRERSAAHIARGAADRGLESFKSQVRDAIIAAAKEHDLCREGTNSVLSDLGLDEWKATYTVTVTRDEDGETILTVTGIEADSEADAEQEVRDNFRVSATVKRVRYDYEYDGEGETDWDCEDFDDDDLSDDDDCGFADSHMDDLTFSAEEE